MTEKDDKYRIDRRTFVKLMGTAVGAIALSRYLPDLIPSASASVQVLQTALLGKAIQKYLTPLPTFGPTAPSLPRVDGTVPLTVTMKEFQQNVLPDAFYTPLLPPYNLGTYVWGYEIQENPIGAPPVVRGPSYPAHTIEAIRGTATTVSYFNNLGTGSPPWPVLQKYLTVDQTLHWADPLMAHPLMAPYTGPVPAVVHLHGGEVLSAYDGHPEAWWTPGAEGIGPLPPGSYRGSEYSTNIYNYPNQQEAATLWFHDHALGITRLNVYAGLAGFYLLRDWTKEPMNLPGGPNDTGSMYEVEIVIQDRMFDINGQWYFPDLGINPSVHPFWIPEFVGDAIVVNGRTWPYLSVDGRRYRFRFLNGSNARFYRMWLENKAAGTPGPVFWQIGTDGGLLDTPVKLDPMDPVMPRFLLLAPGERADVIIDFKGFEGQPLTLRNNARAPYPKGAAADPQTVGQIMQFRVNPTPVPTDPSLDPSTLPNLRVNLIQRLVNPATGTPNVVPDIKRQLTLNEVMGPLGPLEVLLNNTKWHGLDPSHPSYVPMLMETEMPRVGATEQWEIINLTADAHPIHLHLIQFQLLNRQNFNVNKYTKAYAAAFPGGKVGGVTYPAGVYMPAYGPPMSYTPATPGAPLGGNPDVTPYLQGPVRPPEPNEAGWKDTVIMYPGEVTRILARWAKLDALVGTTTPGSNTYPFVPTTGPGYVWHCHILDHEDNEMMRPYKVQP